MKKIVLALIDFYKKAISPYLPSACRFTPTCSEYAYIAVKRFGVLKGSFIALKRLLRCNPFNKNTGYDPVPDTFYFYKHRKDNLQSERQGDRY